LIALIQRDENKARLIKELTSTQNYVTVDYTGLLLRSFELPDLDLITIRQTFYNENFFLDKNGLNELLRIFFNQSEQESFEITNIELLQELILDKPIIKWLDDFKNFANDYQIYYFDKYENKETGKKPYGKFLNLIQDISFETSGFLYWFKDAIEKTNDFLSLKEGKASDTWSESLLYSPQGEFPISFVKFAVKFSLLKNYQRSLNHSQTLIS
jgi:hypothetical protein